MDDRECCIQKLGSSRLSNSSKQDTKSNGPPTVTRYVARGVRRMVSITMCGRQAERWPPMNPHTAGLLYGSVLQSGYIAAPLSICGRNSMEGHVFIRVRASHGQPESRFS